MAATIERMIGEPWKCAHCNEFIYSKKFIDGEFYPVAGAPPAHYLSVYYPRVCSTCFFLWNLIGENAYWKQIQADSKEETNKRQRLRPGADYFGG